MFIDNKIVIVCIAGFIAGIFFDSIFQLGFTFFLLFVIVSASLFIYNKFLSSKIIPDRKILFVSFFILLFAIGVLRYEIKDISPKSFLSEKIDQKVVILGNISDEPQNKYDYLKITVSAVEIYDDNAATTLSGEKILISTDLYPKYEYGDLIKISGELTLPENFSNGTGNIFDYKEFLAKEGVYYKIDFATAEKVGHSPQSKIKELLFFTKNLFLEAMKRNIHEPESSLLAGLLLGEKDSMGKDLEDTFRKAGVSHIVVLSGYNITIIAESVLKFFSFLPVNISLFIAIIFIILFSIMTGGSATVVRASIMAILVVLARFSHRNYDIKRALIFAGLVMIIINPKILVFDSSFQLSFLATLALIYVSPIIGKRIPFVTEKFGLREIVSATISTQILVLPLIIFKMGEFSLVSLPVNLLVLLFVPITMFLGFLTVVFSFFAPILASLFSFLAYGFLYYELFVIKIFAGVSFATAKLSNFGPHILLICYLILVPIILYFRKKDMKC